MVYTAATITTLLVLASDAVPAGVPGEWVWQRHEWPADLLDAAERFLPAMLLGVLLFVVAAIGATWAAAERRRAIPALFALVALSWGWMDAVEHSAPPAHRAAKPYFVLYDPSASGYFFEAAFLMESRAEFLRGYEARMREGEVLHVGTHPPGLFLLHRAAISLCQSSPRLVRLLAAVENRDVRDALRQLEFPRMRPLDEHEVAALHLVSSCTSLAAALVVVPLFVLLAGMFDRRTAWMICCLWPTVPAIAVFAPKSDVLFTLTATSTLALAVTGIRRRSVTACLFGAVFLWLGLMMSLAHLPVLVVLCLFVAVRAFRNRDRRALTDMGLLSIVLVAVLLASAVWSAANDCNLFRVWQWNLSNHAGFYEQYVRTWWKWLLVNPVELSFAIGLPLAVTAVTGTVSATRSVLTCREHPEAESSDVTLVAAAMATFVLLWLSGKNQGEAARLWCFLMPWFLIAAAVWCMSRTSTRQTSDPVRRLDPWHWLLLSQMVCCMATVSRISGFSF